MLMIRNAHELLREIEAERLEKARIEKAKSLAKYVERVFDAFTIVAQRNACTEPYGWQVLYGLDSEFQRIPYDEKAYALRAYADGILAKHGWEVYDDHGELYIAPETIVRS